VILAAGDHPDVAPFATLWSRERNHNVPGAWRNLTDVDATPVFQVVHAPVPIFRCTSYVNPA